MKITITTGLYPPEIGGPATYTVLLEKELPKKGHTVKALPFSRSRHLPKIFRHIHFFFLVVNSATDSDVLYAQDVASVGLPTLLAAKVLGKKFFVRVPGDYAWEQSTQRFGVTDNIDDFQSKKYGLKVEVLRNIQKFVTGHADKVITPSDYFNKLVTGWGVKPEKVFTIYNGVNLDIKPAEVIKSSKKLMVTAGRLVPWKGFPLVISLLSELPDWGLVILGGGPDEMVLKDLVKELNLEDRVIFVGVVSREEVFGWCKVADAFVLNTSFESFSYQIVEAMASGVPIVTTNVGSLPELITNGVEGALVEVDDKKAFIEKIKSIETNKEIWQKRKSSARLKSAKFSIDKTMEKFNELLQVNSV